MIVFYRIILTLFWAAFFGFWLWLAFYLSNAKIKAENRFEQWQREQMRRFPNSPNVDISYERWRAEGRPGLFDE